MNFSACPEFLKELKKFSKKWRTLDEDLEDAKVQITSLYIDDDKKSLVEYRDAFFDNKRATIITKNDGGEVVKMRLDCAALGNKDIIRLIFIYIKYDDEVKFIELYAKNEKSREDLARIRKYF
ncbi:MAG: hypothetical protein PHO93_01060 [Candidatus Saccharimonadaceae bacterium]|nr:hypothetical protein [Candidatus Saccharimonadaceae bacterium]